ncbi:NAD(P)H-dependent oxidoreductase [Thermobifida alba]|uniref:NAD(P)H-dependent oxidoreductase n=1 Tax=Thermobifida alba TaxID=53522 RepID=A0ABY4L323_THEAE|nr:NAD(P)H-dependent oxidoreductase [Thermobifida alba]UPT22069.1 NAD(P)H-dependent oxidoreductase [Thermobifida alba]
MTNTPLRLAVVIGSIREGRFGPTVAQWITEEARSFGQFDVDVVDLADAGLPMRITDTAPPEVEALRPRLAAADAFIMVVPEYNRGYPASLKTLIDWYIEEWQAKPVGFVSYGGRGGALRSVDHVSAVLSDLHAVPLRDTVSFHDAWDKFDASGRPVDREGAEAAAKILLDRLLWWGSALRSARLEHPYNR